MCIPYGSWRACARVRFGAGIGPADRMGSYPFHYLVAYPPMHPTHVRSKHGQVNTITMVARVGTHDDNRPRSTCQIADLPASTSLVDIQMYEARARQHGCGYSTGDACMAHAATDACWCSCYRRLRCWHLAASAVVLHGAAVVYPDRVTRRCCCRCICICVCCS